MIEIAAGLEASYYVSALRRSVWVYPLVNAGHILGLALLIGSVIPMDIALLRQGRIGAMAALRPYALFGFLLAFTCGLLLFAVQATEYLLSPWFLGKLAVILLALVNAARHLWLQRQDGMPRATAATSLVLWISALICGRMIAYG